MTPAYPNPNQRMNGEPTPDSVRRRPETALRSTPLVPDTAEVPSFRNDYELVSSAARGVRSAQDALADRLACVPAMVRRRSITRRIPRPTERDDLVQDVVLAVWKNLDSFRRDGVVESWVWGFVVNQTCRRAERAARRPLSLSLDDAGHEPQTAEREFTDLGAEIASAIATLSSIDASIVQSRHQEDASFESIGATVNMPVNTVKTRYYRALKKLGFLLRGALATPVK